MPNRVVRLSHVARALVVLAALAIHSIAFAQATLSGTMHTEILDGTCQGTLEMNMTAERV